MLPSVKLSIVQFAADNRLLTVQHCVNNTLSKMYLFKLLMLLFHTHFNFRYCIATGPAMVLREKLKNVSCLTRKLGGGMKFVC